MGSVHFRASRRIDAGAHAVWATATDWAAHSRWVPLTSVTVTHDAGGLGTTFVGRTAVGPIGFNDPMTVTLWQPPAGPASNAACTVTKTGRLLTGTAGFTISAHGPNACTLEWFEDVDVAPRWLTGPLGRVIAALATPGLRGTLGKLAADVPRA